MTSDPWKELGFAIRQARLDLEWSLSDLAGRALGNEARKGYVGQVEKGARNLSPETIDKFDQALDLPAEVVKAAQLAPPPVKNNQIETAKSEKVDQVAEKLIAKAQADEAGAVTGERLLIDLAYDFAEGQHTDLFTAYKGLRAALEAAQEIKAQGNLPQNTSSQLDAVLRRVSEMNEVGDRDAAAEYLAAEENRLSAEAEALFNAQLNQDRVRNRPDLAAMRLYKDTARRAHDSGTQRFHTINDLANQWQENGNKSGDIFTLEVALELAKANNKTANRKEAAQALYTLGWSHLRLAERSTSRHHLVVARNAFQASVKKTNKAKEPLKWAVRQAGLAQSLQDIGDRNRDVGILRKSVSIFRAALKVEREHDGSDLRICLNNFGNALWRLAEITADPVVAEEAIAHLTEALSFEDKGTDPIAWESTQRNLGIALRWLGALTKDLGTLVKARAAYEECEALEIRETAPMYWAKGQWSIADLALAQFLLDPDPAHLAEARECVMQARDFFAEGSEYHTRRCDDLIALIDAAEAAP